MHGKIAGRAAIAVSKAAALAEEADVLTDAPRTQMIRVETESFTSGTAPYVAMKALAKRGVRVELIVSKGDLNPRELGVLRSLASYGVAIRKTRTAGKLAVTGERAWIGSANATWGGRDQVDWGLRVDDPRLREALKKRFDSTWMHATRLELRKAKERAGVFVRNLEHIG